MEILEKSFSGEVIGPQDARYEQARSTFSHKGSPALVVRPTSGTDVAAAIRHARDNRLVLSVRSGGHSGAGYGTNDGGLVIDLSGLNRVELVDPGRRLVRIGAGATWGEVANVLQPHRLAISSGDTRSVGVGGLTLGGGIGWMVRKQGLALDSLVAAEVVTADGGSLRASAAVNADLFWALRGGGGNFGVVTSFEFTAHPLGRVQAGLIQYGVDELRRVLTGWRDAMRAAPEELCTTFFLMPAFAGNPPALQILFCYAGDDEAAARRAIEPLLGLGRLVRHSSAAKEYGEVLEEAHQPPDTLRFVVRNAFAAPLGDELIGAVSADGVKTGGFMVQVRSLGGALARVPADATAFAHRGSEALLIFAAFLPAGASGREEAAALEPWEPIAALASGAYANFLATATAGDVAAVYPPATYQRLAEIKRKYDPQNLFSRNLNIRPA